VLFLAVMAVACEAAAHADEPGDLVAPAIVPQCLVYRVPLGQVCGYLVATPDGAEAAGMEQWRDVLRADAELVATRESVRLLTQKADLLFGQTQDLLAAFTAMKTAVAALEGRNAQLMRDLIEKDRLYQNERVKPRFGSPLAWTTAAVLGAVLAGYLGHDLLTD
jgi:hypothetical protein